MSRKHWFFDEEHSPKVQINQNITDDVVRIVIDFVPSDVCTVLTRRRVNLLYDGNNIYIYKKKKKHLQRDDSSCRNDCSERARTAKSNAAIRKAYMHCIASKRGAEEKKLSTHIYISPRSHATLVELVGRNDDKSETRMIL